MAASFPGRKIPRAEYRSALRGLRGNLGVSEAFGVRAGDVVCVKGTLLQGGGEFIEVDHD